MKQNINFQRTFNCFLCKIRENEKERMKEIPVKRVRKEDFMTAFTSRFYIFVFCACLISLWSYSHWSSSEKDSIGQKNSMIENKHEEYWICSLSYINLNKYSSLFKNINWVNTVQKEERQ